MKKALSILLAMTLLFSIGIIFASADDQPASKLSPELKKIIASGDPDDVVRITVVIDGYDKRVEDMPSYPQYDQAFREYLDYLNDLEENVLPQLLDGITPAKVVATGIGNYVAVETTVQNVERIAQIERVKEVGYRPYKYFKDYDGGISAELQAVLDKSEPDDIIPIFVFFGDRNLRLDDMKSWPDKSAAADEYSAYWDARNEFLEARVLHGAECTFRIEWCFWILDAKAKDIPLIAESAHVLDIDIYEDKEILPAETIADEKIDPLVIGFTNCDVCTQDVYIELDLDTKLPKEMPSWPDYFTAHREYAQYLQYEQYPKYSKILNELSALVPLENVRNICCDALTCRIENTVEAIKTLASDEHVKAIKYFEYDPYWNTDHQEYDVDNSRNRYRERLIGQYHFLDPAAPCDMYQELYYHPYDPDDKESGCDWALVEASYGTVVATAEYHQVVGGRLLWAPNTFQKPFTFDIGIYDAEQDRFFDITEIDFDDYPGLYEIWQRMDIGELTEMEQRGDADGDMDVTILDATRIQRRLADIESRNNIVATGADADGDGEITVLDATRIQRYKADLCSLDGAPAEDAGSDYEVGSILVTAATGDPRSISRARNTVLNTLDGFGIESIGMRASTEVTATFQVTFVEKSAVNDQKAIDILKQTPDIISVKPYQGELSRYEADGFEPGRIIISGSGYDSLLKDFEIEETRLLTPGSGRSVYLIIFKEKTKDIVWRALELLETCPTVGYADPDYYYYADV